MRCRVCRGELVFVDVYNGREYRECAECRLQAPPIPVSAQPLARVLRFPDGIDVTKEYRDGPERNPSSD